MKILSKEFLNLINLFEAQTFYIYKTIKGVVIYKNKNLIYIIFQIIKLSLEYFNNSKNFVIIDFILSFYKNHPLIKKLLDVTNLN